MDAEADSILDFIRRVYRPSEEEFEEDYAGMTRGERAEAMEKRQERCEDMVGDFNRRWARPKDGAVLPPAEAQRRRKAIAGLMRELCRFPAIATVKVDDFFAGGMGEEERAVEAERRRRKKLEKARRLRGENFAAAERLEADAAILDFDPKQGGTYYNRWNFVDLSKFDLNEESPIGPMRFTYEVYENKDDYKSMLCEAINILSVKIASSDVGFPIHVYGTVIARDSVDEKCLYLFCRKKEHCQVINSEDEPLILTGPKRGLMILDMNYVEIDLKIKDHQGQERELSKGYLAINGRLRQPKEYVVGKRSLATRLSTMDVMYAYMERAVEATIAIECVQGDFYGEITAHTDYIRDNIVLYDSKLDSVLTGDGKGAIQLMRPVVAVSLKDMLYIVILGGDGKSGRTIRFTPRVCCGEEDLVFVGAMKMRVKVRWSVMDF